MYTQTLFIGSSPCGPATPRRLHRVREELWAPPSYAWFCPVCADIWARAFVPGEEFQVTVNPCIDHELKYWRTLVPGSLLLVFDPEFNLDLSLEAWAREFEVHVRYFERQIQS